MRSFLEGMSATSLTDFLFSMKSAVNFSGYLTKSFFPVRLMSVVLILPIKKVDKFVLFKACGKSSCSCGVEQAYYKVLELSLR